jgi:hypothetical protein
MNALIQNSSTKLHTSLALRNHRTSNATSCHCSSTNKAVAFTRGRWWRRKMHVTLAFCPIALRKYYPTWLSYEVNRHAGPQW